MVDGFVKLTIEQYFYYDIIKVNNVLLPFASCQIYLKTKYKPKYSIQPHTKSLRKITISKPQVHIFADVHLFIVLRSSFQFNFE